jgi:molybdopterin converting factor small subunit
MLGRVYIIQSPNTDKVYIGSTIQTLEERFCQHKRPSNDTNSYLVIDEGETYIELLEEIKVIDETELRFYEQQYLELYSDVAVNKMSAFGRDKEKVKENNKNYREKNQDNIQKLMKKYHEEHKELHHENCKKYYQEHKDKISEKRKEKLKCSCGGEYTKTNMSRHLKSQKHKNYIATL